MKKEKEAEMEVSLQEKLNKRMKKRKKQADKSEWAFNCPKSNKNNKYSYC